MVGTEPALAGEAVDQRVGEVRDVAAGDPDFRVRHQGGIEPDHVVALLDHRLPPGVADIPLQFHTERAVVVRIGEAAVHLGSGKDKPPPLGKGDDRIEVGSRHGLRVMGMGQRVEGRATLRFGAVLGAAALRGRVGHTERLVRAANVSVPGRRAPYAIADMTA